MDTGDYSIWGSAADDVYVVGHDGLLLHYNGSQWNAMESGTGKSLWGIWGAGTNNVFAVGDGNTIVHYDGTNWYSIPDIPYAGGSLPSIWGISAIPCKGDYDCDNDVDGTDAALFKKDFGRSPLNNPCPVCVGEDWCIFE